MKLVASMPVRNEMRRYLPQTIPKLLEYVDEIRVIDDGSDDFGFEYLDSLDGVEVKRNPGVGWRVDEGGLRQELLRWTLEAKPTHVLAIDADEVIPEGHLLIGRISEARERSMSLRMVEVWDRSGVPWKIRTDGGWAPHEVAIVWRVPNEPFRPEWQMRKRRLAGGRVPAAVLADSRFGSAKPLGLDILHLGWSNPEERESRHARYVELDGGRFHASSHLDSILDPERLQLDDYDGLLVP